MTLFSSRKKRGRAPREELVHGSIPWIVSALIAGLIPHTPHIPIWIPVWCLLLWGYSILAEIRGLPMPKAITRFFMTLLGIAGVLFATQGVVDNTFGASLLCAMAGLKTLEIRRERDLFISIFIAYFMVVSSLFFSASLVMTLYMVGAMVHITAVLIRVNVPASPMKEALKVAGAITAKAIPLTLVLFFLFPRIDGNIFGITPRRSASSGFSDTLSPGSVSQLAQSSVPVFRASFSSGTPAPQLRYFRGITFQKFDGRSWKTGEKPAIAPGGIGARSAITYRITYETKQVDRLFPLDMPLSIPKGAILNGDFTIPTPKSGIKDTPYEFTSGLSYNTGNLYQWERVFLTLPERGNVEARALASSFRNTSGSTREVVNKALDYFANQDFKYTLSPPPLETNPIDTFLFETRRGYCEHFASAFTFLMRAAGIPARVVGGYLGGSVNPFGDYLIVRQSDAHAWCEVWLKNQGWVRIDPTSVVAPERVEQGAAFALPEFERPSFFIDGSSSLFSKAFNRIRLGWDAINYQWDAKVIGYSFSLQTTFFKRLGITSRDWKGWLKVAFWIMGTLGVIMGVGWFLLEFKNRERFSHVETSWRIFKRKMEKAGVPKAPGEGPLDFLERIEEERPSAAPEARKIAGLYVELTYGRASTDAGKPSELRKKVRGFRPPPQQKAS